MWERWHDQVNPEINHSAWIIEEENMFVILTANDEPMGGDRKAFVWTNGEQYQEKVARCAGAKNRRKARKHR